MDYCPGVARVRSQLYIAYPLTSFLILVFEYICKNCYFRCINTYNICIYIFLARVYKSFYFLCSTYLIDPFFIDDWLQLLLILDKLLFDQIFQLQITQHRMKVLEHKASRYKSYLWCKFLLIIIFVSIEDFQKRIAVHI